MLGNFSCFCCRLLTFFQNKLFQKVLSGILSECQMVWNKIRTDRMSVLILFQTVCKGYKQMKRYVNSQTTKGHYIVALIIKLIIETSIVSDLYEAPALCHKPYLGPVIKLVVDSCVHSLGFLRFFFLCLSLFVSLGHFLNQVPVKNITIM